MRRKICQFDEQLNKNQWQDIENNKENDFAKQKKSSKTYISGQFEEEIIEEIVFPNRSLREKKKCIDNATSTIFVKS